MQLKTWACTKTRNAKTKPSKRNHRNDRNETTETTETKQSGTYTFDLHEVLSVFGTKLTQVLLCFLIR